MNRDHLTSDRNSDTLYVHRVLIMMIIYYLTIEQVMTKSHSSKSITDSSLLKNTNVTWRSGSTTLTASRLLNLIRLDARTIFYLSDFLIPRILWNFNLCGDPANKFQTSGTTNVRNSPYLCFEWNNIYIETSMAHRMNQ